MTTLHIVRKSAFNTSDFVQCLQVTEKNDVVVFIDDGCYNLCHDLITKIEQDKSVQLKVIEAHASARGVTINDDICTKISMNELVSLTFTNDRVITWQ